MRKWLQDPKVVGALGVFALLYMIFTFWPKSPTVPVAKPIKVPVSVETSATPVQIPVLNSTKLLDLDSVKISNLDSIQWKRKSNRDPFVVEKRKGNMAYWVLREDAPRQTATPHAKSKTKKQSSPVYRLQAVAIGPAGKLALVNGKWYTEGIAKGSLLFKTITPDSVVLMTGSKPQILRFKSEVNHANTP